MKENKLSKSFWQYIEKLYSHKTGSNNLLWRKDVPEHQLVKLQLKEVDLPPKHLNLGKEVRTLSRD